MQGRIEDLQRNLESSVDHLGNSRPVYSTLSPKLFLIELSKNAEKEHNLRKEIWEAEEKHADEIQHQKDLTRKLENRIENLQTELQKTFEAHKTELESERF